MTDNYNLYFQFIDIFLPGGFREIDYKNPVLYQDKEMLLNGNIFSKRELLIIEFLGKGLSTNQIADKLFLSTHTINTHRRNILKKTGKSSTLELILDLKTKGML